MKTPLTRVNRSLSNKKTRRTVATSSALKVYYGAEYRATCKYPEDAAALVAFLGDGATIQYNNGNPVWTEGKEDQSAAESYDHVAYVIRLRIGIF